MHAIIACSSNPILLRSFTLGIFSDPVGSNANEVMVFNTPLLCLFVCNFLGSGVTFSSSGRVVTVGPHNNQALSHCFTFTFNPTLLLEGSEKRFRSVV